MQNVTIAMDEELVRLTEAEAAKAGKSLSDFISDLVARELAPVSDSQPESTNSQLEALQRVWAGPMWDLTENGRLPNAEERNARR